MAYSAKQFLRDLKQPYAWPGGYPRYFILSDGEALSFKDAEKNKRLIVQAIRAKDNRGGWRVVGVDVNWEDDELYSVDSGEKIESAYSKNPRGRRRLEASQRLGPQLRYSASGRKFKRRFKPSPLSKIPTSSSRFRSVTDPRKLKRTMRKAGIRVNPSSKFGRLYTRGPDGYPAETDQVGRDFYARFGERGKIPKITRTTKFQHFKGGVEVPAEVYGWDWSSTFGRWGAYVRFADGMEGFTYPWTYGNGVAKKNPRKRRAPEFVPYAVSRARRKLRYREHVPPGAPIRIPKRARKAYIRGDMKKFAELTRRSIGRRFASDKRFHRNPSRGPHVWQIVAAIRPGQSGAEFGVDAVTPQTWHVVKKPVSGREYGYSLPDELTRTEGFRAMMGGKVKRDLYGSLVSIRGHFRKMLAK